MSVNKVILVGRLGQNPEIRYTPAGAAVANFSLATNESWVDKSGQKQERTEWHRIVVWGKLAELCNQYLQKGRQAYVEGRLQTRQWQDKENQTRYTTEIQAQTVQFLGGGAERSAPQQEYGASNDFSQGGPSGGGAYSGASAGGFSGGGAHAGTPGAMNSGQDTGSSFTEDDIPF